MGSNSILCSVPSPARRGYESLVEPGCGSAFATLRRGREASGELDAPRQARHRDPGQPRTSSQPQSTAQHPTSLRSALPARAALLIHDEERKKFGFLRAFLCLTPLLSGSGNVQPCFP